MSSKTLFLAICDPRSSIVKSVFDCRLPGVRLLTEILFLAITLDFGMKLPSWFPEPRTPHGNYRVISAKTLVYAPKRCDILASI